MGINNFVNKVRKRDNRFYDFLYLTAKKIQKIEMPSIPVIHDFLYYERIFRIDAWRSFWRVFYHQPIFKRRCFSCGKGLHLYHSGQGLPVIIGDLKIVLGDNVKIYDMSTFGALTIGETPTLKIGDNTDLVTGATIFVGNEVEIGNDCMIGCRLISDNPGHNTSIEDRDKKLDTDKIGRVKIGDRVWAALDSVIVGDIEIGYGSIIAARSVVTKSVPPMTVVGGNPAKVIRHLEAPHPEAMAQDECDES
jgi:acetyltransferase-like isoleucine patch superfamily enzyme